jgi:Polyketide cyclase / dehydrase and lipid transport
MSKATPLSVSVSRVIDADANTLYGVMSDVTSMPKFSPENIKAEWINGATGPAVGAKFKGTNKLGSTTWSTKPTVTAADPGRLFAFQVNGSSGALWTYQFATNADGSTTVTESMAQTKASSALIRWFQRRAGVTDRAANLRAAMALTLDKVAAVVATTNGVPAR